MVCASLFKTCGFLLGLTNFRSWHLCRTAISLAKSNTHANISNKNNKPNLWIDNILHIQNPKRS